MLFIKFDLERNGSKTENSKAGNMLSVCLSCQAGELNMLDKIIYIISMSEVALWLERMLPMRKVYGSSPTRCPD